MTCKDCTKEYLLGKWAVLSYLSEQVDGPRFYMPIGKSNVVYSYDRREEITINEAIEDFATYLKTECEQ